MATCLMCRNCKELGIQYEIFSEIQSTLNSVAVKQIRTNVSELKDAQLNDKPHAAANIVTINPTKRQGMSEIPQTDYIPCSSCKKG